MAYSELIKNFNRTRDYMREFYLYGFKSREECEGVCPQHLPIIDLMKEVAEVFDK